MKLDRNKNPDGRGKYGLVKMRRLEELQGPLREETERALRNLEALGVIEITPKEPGDQFFVMRYKDRFTYRGLAGYMDGIEDRLNELHDDIDRNPSGCEAKQLIEERDSLMEYFREIEAELYRAQEFGQRIPD